MPKKIKLIVKKTLFKMTGVVELKTNLNKKGSVLLSYMTSPFLTDSYDLTKTHTNYWECHEIARLFLEKGYDVDVINWNNFSFKPKKRYNIIVDIHKNIERLAPLLGDNCKKIFHITGAHWLYMNNAEYQRLNNLKERRKIVLYPRRNVIPSLNIENCDYATFLGNKFTADTYLYSGKKLINIPISTTITIDFPQKNFEECKKNFVWFGGSGLIHKGLDLALEAFKDMPDLNLYVCGPINKEPDFEKAFYNELYKTKNIKTIGWAEYGGDKFLEITKKCAFLIYPSCSEGGGGSVIAAMHAGLIPIISYESSVDVYDFGVLLNKSDKKCIKEAARIFSQKNTKEIELMSKKSWDHARKNFTRNEFSKKFTNFLDNFIIT